MNNDWLKQLLPGDEVVVCSRMSGSTLCRVDRITSTQLIVRGLRFRRSDGTIVGGGAWCTTFLEPATEERRSKIVEHKERDRIIGRLSNRVLWTKLTLPQLREINARLTCMEAAHD